MSSDEFSSTEQPNGSDAPRVASPGAGLQPGYRLEEYIIEKEIGAGGFGKTYLARDMNLDKKVAIKEYFPLEYACRNFDESVSPSSNSAGMLETDQWGLDSFIKEAQNLAKCEHPNIIRVIRYIKDNGTAYLITEFADGPDLEKVLQKRGKLSAEDVFQILKPLSEGLQKVHNAGILHRDIKPANIILRSDGTPVLIDFGAARQAIGSRSKDLSVILTKGYAPYEQYFQSGNQGPWTDIYALGATAYHCLMGDLPQEGAERITADRTPLLAEVFPNDPNLPFLTALDWSLRPANEDRPQNLSEWQGAMKVSETGSDFRGSAPTIIHHDPNPTLLGRGPYQPPAPKPIDRKPLPIAYIAGGVGVLAAIAIVVFALQLSSDKDTSVVVNGPNTIKTDPAPVSASALTVTPTPAPAPAPAPGPSPTQIAKDNSDFTKAKLINSTEAYTLYLELHPKGVNAREAIRLQALDRKRRRTTSRQSLPDNQTPSRDTSRSRMR